MSLMAKKREKTVPMYVRWPVRLKKAMEDQANESRRDFSVEMAIAAEEYLERLGKWPPPPEDDDAKPKDDRKRRGE